MSVSEEDLKAARAAMSGAGTVTADGGAEPEAAGNASAGPESVTAIVMWILCLASGIAAGVFMAKGSDVGAGRGYGVAADPFMSQLYYAAAVGNAVSAMIFAALAAIASNSHRARIAAEETLKLLRKR